MEQWLGMPFNTLEQLAADDLDRIIYIRNMGHTVAEAINRQLAHYPYHVGQIVFIGKMLCNEKWSSLSIPKGGSEIYNTDKFAKEKHRSILPMSFGRIKNRPLIRFPDDECFGYLVMPALFHGAP